MFVLPETRSGAVFEAAAEAVAVGHPAMNDVSKEGPLGHMQPPMMMHEGVRQGGKEQEKEQEREEEEGGGEGGSFPDAATVGWALSVCFSKKGLGISIV